MPNHDVAIYVASIIFALTYAGLAFGKIPGLLMDRAGIALVGATLMLVSGMISLQEATGQDSIDYKTLALLFGMMVVVGYLHLSGFFETVAELALKQIHTPLALLATIVLLSGILSAFLINDIVCLTMTPLVVHLARRLRFDPVPHLIALATAANIGSSGTITGNPQNIFIGAHSGISYLHFALRLLPIAAIGLVISFAVIAIVYRRRLARPPENVRQAIADERDANERTERIDGDFRHVHRLLQRKSMIVTLAAILLFFTGLPLELVAMGAAAVLLAIGRVRPDKIYRQIDWSLLLMFVGLFVVVHAFQMHVVSRWGIEHWQWLLNRPVDCLSLASAGLSNLVSNVPAVLLLEPVVQAIPAAAREHAWLTLAMSSTLAGNLTVVGSVANLIVMENANREGIRISFWEYFRVGLPLTIVTLAIGIAWLEFVRY